MQFYKEGDAAPALNLIPSPQGEKYAYLAPTRDRGE